MYDVHWIKDASWACIKQKPTKHRNGSVKCIPAGLGLSCLDVCLEAAGVCSVLDDTFLSGSKSKSPSRLSSGSFSL